MQELNLSTFEEYLIFKEILEENTLERRIGFETNNKKFRRLIIPVLDKNNNKVFSYKFLTNKLTLEEMTFEKVIDALKYYLSLNKYTFTDVKAFTDHKKALDWLLETPQDKYIQEFENDIKEIHKERSPLDCVGDRYMPKIPKPKAPEMKLIKEEYNPLLFLAEDLRKLWNKIKRKLKK